jgi:hypothetical protein
MTLSYVVFDVDHFTSRLSKQIFRKMSSHKHYSRTVLATERETDRDLRGQILGCTHRVPTPTPPPSFTRGKADRNQLNKEITPLLPTGIGEELSQTISNLGHAALLRRCELPL